MITYFGNEVYNWKKVYESNLLRINDGSISVGHDNVIYSFGLFYDKTRTAEYESILYDIKRDEIRFLKQPPKVRGSVFRSATIFGDKIILFSGGEFNTLLIFDITKKEWSIVLTNGERPTKRVKHSIVVHHEELIIYGGMFSELKNDCFALNLKTYEWRRISFNDSPYLMRHTASMIKEKMITVGGFLDNSVYKFDLENNTWKRLSTIGEEPPTCEEPTYFTHADAVYLCFPYLNLGTLYKLHLPNLEWRRIIIKGNIPSSRFRASMVVMDNIMYMCFGTYRGDIWAMELTQKYKIGLYNRFTDLHFAFAE